MLRGMDNNPSTKNIVVVQDMTNGLSHVIESETNGGEDVKKYVSVVSPTAPLPVPLPSMSWSEADKTEEAFRITQLHDSSLVPDQELSESESQIKKEVELTIKCAKKRLNKQN